MEELIGNKKENKIKTNIQIEVYLFKKSTRGVKFLLLKRKKERGGFWQPITGGVIEGESIEKAIKREVQEETEIQDIQRIIDTGYSFSFIGEDGRDLTEFIYGAEVGENVREKISPEHEEACWVSKEKALTLLRWRENKEGLLKLYSMM